MQSDRTRTMGQVQQIGIVQCLDEGGSKRITFSRPRLLIYFFGSLIGLSVLLSLTALAVNHAKGMPCVFIMLVPCTILFLACRHYYSHTSSVTLAPGRIRYTHRDKGGEAVSEEVDIDHIHNISSEASDLITLNIIEMLVARFIPKYAEILVIAEPRNLVIKGPRKFTSSERNFLLKTLNAHRHRIAVT